MGIGNRNRRKKNNMDNLTLHTASQKMTSDAWVRRINISVRDRKLYYPEEHDPEFTYEWVTQYCGYSVIQKWVCSRFRVHMKYRLCLQIGLNGESVQNGLYGQKEKWKNGEIVIDLQLLSNRDSRLNAAEDQE